MLKSEVRRLAREAGLPVSEKKDSTGVCFIGERNFKQFLAGFLPAQPGDMVTPEGRVVGKHIGLMYYTLGQRRGLGVSAPHPLYVAGKDSADNTILLTGEGRLYRTSLVGHTVNYIPFQTLTAPMEVTAKTRHSQHEQPATVYPEADGRVRAVFEQPQRAVTARAVAECEPHPEPFRYLRYGVD